jgi:hypothetical protein
MKEHLVFFIPWHMHFQNSMVFRSLIKLPVSWEGHGVLAPMCTCFLYLKYILVMSQNVKKFQNKNSYVGLPIVHAHNVVP